MSVKIDIPMPKTCDECRLKTWDNGWREYICTVVGIPIMEHGRLGGCPIEPIEEKEQDGNVFV